MYFAQPNKNNNSTRINLNGRLAVIPMITTHFKDGNRNRSKLPYE